VHLWTEHKLLRLQKTVKGTGLMICIMGFVPEEPISEMKRIRLARVRYLIHPEGANNRHIPRSPNFSSAICNLGNRQCAIEQETKIALTICHYNPFLTCEPEQIPRTSCHRKFASVPKVDGRLAQFPYSGGLGNQFDELMRRVAII